MEKKTKKAVDKAIDVYEAALISELTKNAIEAHIAGDLVASSLLKIPIARNIVQQESLVYGKTYSKLLREKGASIIQGKEIPWLSEHTEHTRQQAYNIIEQGLKEGKPVADIGGKRGAPGTIADDLKQLGIRDKDYEYVRIARTESARIQNQGTLNRYVKNNITHVLVHDGGQESSCEICNELGGSVWTVEYSQTHELEHPGCIRSFSAIIPDDWVAPEQ